MNIFGSEKYFKIIGIAGGIGSGKSTVTDYLRHKMYYVYDADEIAREAVMPGEPALVKLTDFFGSEILNDDGSLNRRKLAQITFGHEDKTRKLNEILHKDIDHRIDLKLAEHAIYFARKKAEDIGTMRVVFISAPLFFEAELEKKCDETWAIIADDEVRIKRAMERDDLPRSEVEDRMNRQMPDKERAKKADHVIKNHGSKEELVKQVEKLLKSL